MPVMDGITATRELKKKYKNLPPIIGVSANALRADAQHYISKGLDDYIAKPVIPAVLYEKLKLWSQGSGRMKSPEMQDETPAEEYAQLPELDLNILESLREQTDYDNLIIQDLYNTYMLESDVLMEKLRIAISENNHDIIKDTTHALKGLSATVGAMRVYHIASEMDQLHKLNIFEESETLYEVLLMDYKKILKIICDKVLNT
jgi:HPt (histidine-containing phosphotransfer) domain-containing protein